MSSPRFGRCTPEDVLYREAIAQTLERDLSCGRGRNSASGRRGGLTYEDAAAVGVCGDAGRFVHAEASEVVSAQQRVGLVHTNAYFGREAIAVAIFDKAPLD